VLSVIGAVAIGSVFTQLLFQNVDSSTFIYLGWLVGGMMTFVVYRRYRRLPLWEPLAEPPLPERVAPHVSIDRPPAGERFKIARRHPAPVAVVGAETAPKTVAVAARPKAERSMRRIAMWVVVATVVSLLALLLDLSPLDPFGPSLGWSPGVLLMVWVSVYLLARGRSEA
jgi:hypothetical protein